MISVCSFLMNLIAILISLVRFLVFFTNFQYCDETQLLSAGHAMSRPRTLKTISDNLKLIKNHSETSKNLQQTYQQMIKQNKTNYSEQIQASGPPQFPCCTAALHCLIERSVGHPQSRHVHDLHAPVIMLLIVLFSYCSFCCSYHSY